MNLLLNLFPVSAGALLALAAFLLLRKRVTRRPKLKMAGASFCNRTRPRNAGRRMWLARVNPAARVNAAELRLLSVNDPELVVFHLVDTHHEDGDSRLVPDEVMVTMPQLEEALAWMLPSTRFAVYQADGIDQGTLRRLKELAYSGGTQLVAAAVGSMVTAGRGWGVNYAHKQGL
jgi:hypothetical protein